MNTSQHKKSKSPSWSRTLAITLGTFAFATLASAFQSTHSSSIEGNSELKSVAYGNGIYTAVGASGSIYTSVDAEVWTAVEKQTEATLHAVSYGAGHFVAVGGKGVVLVSDTGQSWEMKASGTAKTLLDVKYGDGKFVAGGEAGVVITSENAMDWSAEASGSAKTIVSIAYGEGKFVAVAVAEAFHQTKANMEQESEVLVSVDAGATWEIEADAEARSVAYAAGEFYIYGRSVVDGTVEATLRTSADATTWVYADLVAELDIGLILGEAESNLNLFVELSGYAKASGFAMAESETEAVILLGSNIAVKAKAVIDSLWAEAESDHDASLRLNGAAHGHAGFVVVGEGGLILHSEDGEEWTSKTSAEAEANIQASAQINDKVIAVGSVSAKASIHSSTSGESWSGQSFEGEATLRGIVEHEGTIVAVGSKKTGEGSIEAAIMVSGDGETFTEVDLSGQSSVSLNAVAYGSGKFVAVHSGTKIMVSADSEIWTEESTGLEAEAEAEAELHAVIYADGKFVAVGENGLVIISADGEAWARVESEVEASLTSVTYAKGVYVAVGANGTITTSTDAEEWHNDIAIEGETFLSVDFVNENYIAVGANGVVYTSLDAHTWVRQEIESDAKITGSAYVDGKYVFTTEASGSLTVEGSLMLNSEPSDGGFHKSVWLGAYAQLATDWYFHPEHGFLFMTGENEQTIKMYHLKLDAWVSTSASIYPYMFSHSSEHDWILYIEGSGGELYFDLTTETEFSISN